MKYTIGIASYNQQEYLPDAIESALSQTHPADEILICDDGSTDHSLAIAKSYEPKVRVISQVNKGLPSARNTLIMNMTGDYFIPLDADDILKETYVEIIDIVASQADVDIIAPSFKCFGVHNDEIILDPMTTFKDFATGNRVGYFSAIRKSKLLEIGGYSPKMIWGYEDLALWINLLNRGATMTILKDVLVLYRTKENSMITIAQKHHAELMEQIAKDFPELYA